MIGFWLVNMIVPNDPEEASISTSSGKWFLKRNVEFDKCKDAISRNQCAHTYSIEIPISLRVDKSAACDTALDEMTPILLGASFLTGLTVTAKMSLPHSEISIFQSSSHWPRERSMGSGNPCVNTSNEFFNLLEKFIVAWPTIGQSEKMLILIHHWLDALSCWSFEDLYLSATTLLQIIAATEEQQTGNNNLTFFQAIQSATNRVGISPLCGDFKDMRNNLIHEGKLLGGRFTGTDKEACSIIVSDVMNWFDEYFMQ